MAEEMDPKEHIARLRANMDQTTAGLKELADMLWKYNRQLRNLGFSKNEAIMIVRDYQVCLLSQLQRKDDDA